MSIDVSEFTKDQLNEQCALAQGWERFNGVWRISEDLNPTTEARHIRWKYKVDKYKPSSDELQALQLLKVFKGSSEWVEENSEWFVTVTINGHLASALNESFEMAVAMATVEAYNKRLINDR